MTTVKLYGVTASRAARCVWMLQELGIDYEHDPIRFDDPALKQAPYLALNPNGRIPTLVVDGEPIFESLAINLFLAQRFPSALSLGTTSLNARAVQWSMWAQSDIDPPITAWAMHTLLRSPAERDPAIAAESLTKLERPLGVLERTLADRPWLLDDRFTVADLNVASTMSRALAWDLADKPRLKDWLHRCWSRPAAIQTRRLRGDPV